MNTKQQGFTLIELVVVIVILGILAAVAVPKFVSIQGDARLSVLRGVEAAVRSTSDMVHAKALAQNRTGATDSLPAGNIEGVTSATALVYGYPATTAITSLVNVSGDSITPTAASGLFQVNGATTAANCQVTYTAPTSATSGPTIAVSATLNCN